MVADDDGTVKSTMHMCTCEAPGDSVGAEEEQATKATSSQQGLPIWNFFQIGVLYISTYFLLNVDGGSAGSGMA